MPTPLPPVEHQFKKGQKAHPNVGRPKGMKNMRTLLREALEQEIDIKDKDGKLLKISKAQAAAARVANILLTGKEETAIHAYIKIIDQLDGKNPDTIISEGDNTLKIEFVNAPKRTRKT